MTADKWLVLVLAAMLECSGEACPCHTKLVQLVFSIFDASRFDRYFSSSATCPSVPSISGTGSQPLYALDIDNRYIFIIDNLWHRSHFRYLLKYKTYFYVMSKFQLWIPIKLTAACFVLIPQKDVCKIWWHVMSDLIFVCVWSMQIIMIQRSFSCVCAKKVFLVSGYTLILMLVSSHAPGIIAVNIDLKL